MIIQGSNAPITLVFDTDPADISVLLCNEIEDIKHWDMEDLDKSETEEATYYARFTQEESMAFPEGVCFVELSYVDDPYVYGEETTGVVHKMRMKDYIVPWKDTSVLSRAYGDEFAEEDDEDVIIDVEES